MKKIILIAVVASIVMAGVACSKRATVINNDNVVVNNGPYLLPLTPGNQWIYIDSVFDSTGKATEIYADTATLTNQKIVLSDYPTIPFYGMYNPNGWFGARTLFAIESTNTYIYQMDSVSKTPYIFYKLSSSDNNLLGTSTDASNPACITNFAQYGFATPKLVNGYSCTRNVASSKNCKNVITQVAAYYVCANVGIVRLEGYVINKASPTQDLYLQFSQTLQKFIPK